MFKYRVLIWESERGWGSKVDDIYDFNTPEEAKLFVEKFNSSNTDISTPDWYMYAEGPHLVEVKDE